jgi:hypothetical protein
MENPIDETSDSLVALGHAIKSASLNIGSLKLARIGKDIEMGNATKDHSELKDLIENEFYEFKSAVMQYAKEKFFNPR